MGGCGRRGDNWACLDAYNRLMPRDIGTFLLLCAAAIRAWIDVMQHIIYRTVGWIPDFLEQLDDWLLERLGPSWWLAMFAATSTQ